MLFVSTDAKKILILLTDGQSGDSVNQPAQQLKSIGVKIFSIGVGSGIDVSELETVASSPPDDHVFRLQNFEDLSSLVEKISDTTCNGIDLYYLCCTIIYDTKYRQHEMRCLLKLWRLKK